jgi:hypothetical protein
MLGGTLFPRFAVCPVCGEEIDLSDRQGALDHMMKDDAHKNRVAEIKTEETLDMAVSAGIMRRV